MSWAISLTHISRVWLVIGNQTRWTHNLFGMLRVLHNSHNFSLQVGFLRNYKAQADSLNKAMIKLLLLAFNHANTVQVKLRFTIAWSHWLSPGHLFCHKKAIKPIDCAWSTPTFLVKSWPRFLGCFFWQMRSSWSPKVSFFLQNNFGGIFHTVTIEKRTPQICQNKTSLESSHKR